MGKYGFPTPMSTSILNEQRLGRDASQHPRHTTYFCPYSNLIDGLDVDRCLFNARYFASRSVLSLFILTAWSRASRARPTRPSDAAACTAARLRQTSQQDRSEMFSARSLSHSEAGDEAGTGLGMVKSSDNLRMAGVRCGRRCSGSKVASICAVHG